MKSKKLVTILTVLMVLSLVMPVRAIEIVPDETTSYYCKAENSIQYNIDENMENCILLLPGYSLWCDTDVDIGFFWGSEFPILMQVLHPSSLLQDCEFQTNYSAIGLEGAKIGAELSSAVSLSLELRNIIGAEMESWILFDDYKGFDFTLGLVTPLGEMNSLTIDGRIKIASLPLYYEFLGVTIIDTEISAYLGVKIDVEIEGVLDSQLMLSGDGLTEDQRKQLIWDEKDEVHSVISATTAESSRTVEITQTDIQFGLITYTASIREIYFTFEFIDFPFFTLPIPFDFVSIDMSGQIFDIDPMETISMQIEVPEPPMDSPVNMLPVLLTGILSVTVLLAIISLRGDD